MREPPLKLSEAVAVMGGVQFHAGHASADGYWCEAVQECERWSV